MHIYTRKKVNPVQNGVMVTVAASKQRTLISPENHIKYIFRYLTSLASTIRPDTILNILGSIIMLV